MINTENLIKIIIFILLLIILAAFLTYAERKIIARIQQRIGPNQTGFSGILQPIADCLKLLSKEIIIPSKANKIIFVLAPAMILIPALMSAVIVPISKTCFLANPNLGLLYFLAVSSIGIYGLVLSAWGSKSSYGLIGGIRAICQMISYEIPLGFIILCIVMISESMNLISIVESQKGMWNVFPLLPLFLVFMIVSFAKTHRAPFDLPEAENELVAGYNVEYSSTLFAMIFLGEYINMLVLSVMAVILFLGGWLPVFGLDFIPGWMWLAMKTSIIIMPFFILRAVSPRLRFDKLLKLSWAYLIPFCMLYFILTATYLQFFKQGV